MFIMHPVFLFISLVCAAVYAIYLNGKTALRIGLLYLLPMLVFAAMLNPLFNHQGGTMLLHLPNGNPVTLESIAFGIASAVMLVTVITWFSCFNAVVSSEKFVYLFGRLIPSLSLIISMALRFIPRFRVQIGIISDAQKGIRRDTSNGNIFQKALHGIKVLSILVTWSLENAIETADSMKSRGYGLPNRTAFSIFTFNKRDGYAIAFIAISVAIVIIGAVAEVYRFRFFPTIRGHWYGFRTASVFFIYFALAIFPIIVNLREDLIWKRIESKI